MRIVVTGSSGRLGRQVVWQLVSQQHEVICIDVQEPKNPLPGHPPTHAVNLMDREALTPLFQGAEAICHLGNFPGFGKAGRSAGFQNNVTATYNVFDAAEEANVLNVVYASSVQAYGVVGGYNNLPLPTPASLPVVESHPLVASNPYALSKVVGEAIAAAAVRRRPDLTAWSLRYTHIADPVQFPNWDKWRKEAGIAAGWAHLAGALSSYIRVEDAAEMTIRCAMLARPGMTAMNITAPGAIARWSEADLIKVYGMVPPIRPGITNDQGLLDGSLAENLLNFRPVLPLMLDGGMLED